MKAKSIQSKDATELSKMLDLVITDGFIPTLAFVFISVVDQIDVVMEAMRSHNIDVFGASTSVEFTDQGVQEGGISVLLLDVDRAYYKIEIFDLKDRLTLEAARKLGETGINNFSNPGFIVSCADLSTPGEHAIHGITEIVGPDAIVIGGISGEVEFFKGWVFTSKVSCSKGIIGLIMDLDKINVQGMAVSGWKSIGTEKMVTKAENSWLKEIDHTPALDVLKKFMGDDIVLNESIGTDHIKKLNISYPLQVQRKTGYVVMRPTLLANVKEKSILCGGIVEEGDVFRFSIPPDFDVIDKVIDSSRRIKESRMSDADAMVIFSCAGRFIDLGPLSETEIEGLSETWETPMAGFFSLGEFGKSEGGEVSEFHGNTCSWVALKEK